MAVVARSTDASHDASQSLTVQSIVGLVTGEGIPCDAPCEIRPDGKIYKATSATKVRGFASRQARVNQPLTLYMTGARFHHSDGGLTPGVDLYLSATPGEFDTTVLGTPIAFAVDANDISVRC